MEPVLPFGDRQIFTKEELIKKLMDISDMGWIRSGRQGNHGGVGNTLEDLLEIEENNLPIPNASEWELKCQKSNTTALTTLFHSEPSPRAIRFVPKILLPYYGWRHNSAGTKHPETEMSFRQTINGSGRSNRGFTVSVNHDERKVEISFDYKYVDPIHADWLERIKSTVGLGELNPMPYWGFDDLFHKAGTKLKNTFYVVAARKMEAGVEYFHYNKIYMLSNFSLEGFLSGLEEGFIYIDFDARSGHNHGTKFRLNPTYFPKLYGNIKTIR